VVEQEPGQVEKIRSEAFIQLRSIFEIRARDDLQEWRNKKLEVLEGSVLVHALMPRAQLRDLARLVSTSRTGPASAWTTTTYHEQQKTKNSPRQNVH
jgi:hypothetical protein